MLTISTYFVLGAGTAHRVCGDCVPALTSYREQCGAVIVAGVAVGRGF